MNVRTFTTLELDGLLKLLARHVQTPLGRRRVYELLPSSNRDWVKLELQRTTECVSYLIIGGTFGLGEITDPEDSLAELQIAGTILEPQDLLALQSLVAIGADLNAQFSQPDSKERYPQLSAITGKIPDLRRMLASIRGKILPNGEIDDNASPELRRIRREINERRNRIYRNLESLMRDRATSVQDEIVTVRNGRFVIPVRTDARAQVPGVMHGLSSSGQTTYVEPLAFIDQNNEMVRLREQEEAEIARILLQITETLRSHLPDIQQIVEAIGVIDFTHAKARLSTEFNCVEPLLKAGRGLILRNARHPLLEQNLKQTGGQIVPITLEMDEEHLTLVVSGPNAGGKTIVTKTVGLIALMAQMGLHVPASEAELPVFEQILADIGDQQSIAANLSTFTAHMKNIADMIRLVAPPALILLDEVGTGTDPDEGAALGIAIVKHFQSAGATTIATTHYNPLKIWASQASNVLNGSVEFDEQTLRPTFRLIVGVAGASAGLEIARRMNVPGKIIEDAKLNLDPAHIQSSAYLKKLKLLVDEQEALRIALEEERQATAEKYANLDLDFAKRESQRRKEFESELAQVISDFSAESERAIKAVQDKVIAARLRKETETRAAELRRSAGVKLRKQAAGSSANPLSPGSATTGAVTQKQQPPAPTVSVFEEEAAEIHERDLVRIQSLNQEGKVESINAGTYTVLIGSLRFRAKREELTLVKTAAPLAKATANLPKGVNAYVSIDEDFTGELNIIGSTVDEAEERVDKFLDAAFMAGLAQIRIVHGHGKGALRQAVAKLLTGHSHVKSFAAAPANEGGTGATLVELKR